MTRRIIHIDVPDRNNEHGLVPMYTLHDRFDVGYFIGYCQALGNATFPDAYVYVKESPTLIEPLITVTGYDSDDETEAVTNKVSRVVDRAREETANQAKLRDYELQRRYGSPANCYATF